MQVANTEQKDVAAAWTTVALLGLITVVSWLDRIILALLVTPIGNDLGLTDGQFGVLLGMGFIGVYILAGLPIAILLDRGNRKRILICAVIVWCLCTIAAGFAQSFLSLLIARCGVAIGEAALIPAAVSMICDLFRPERRRLPTSVFMTFNILGATGAFLIGGLVIAFFDRLGLWQGLASWRLTLISVGVAGLPVIALFAIAAREPGRPSPTEREPDTGATWLHLRAHAPLYLYTFAGVGLLAMVAQGSAAWLPTLLARGYQLEPARIGALMALTFAPASVLGIGLLPVLLGELTGRPLVLRILSLALLACALAVPFAIFVKQGSLTALLATGAISMLGQGALVALVAMLIQSITPASMRARMMALAFLFLNLLGAGLAPVAVAWTATNLFTGPRALGDGLSTIALAGLLGGGLCFLLGYVWSRKRSFVQG
jgi:MFS family permease